MQDKSIAPTCADCNTPIKSVGSARCNRCASKFRWSRPEFRSKTIRSIQAYHQAHPRPRNPPKPKPPAPPRTGPHANFRHGLKDTPEYRAWSQAKGRCSNPKLRNFHIYGGRGIRVCERWNDFLVFLADMGPRPSDKHSLDRIDGNGDYCPENCRWATIEQQANNTSTNRFVTMNGETLTIAQWARRTGLQAGTIQFRLAHGWEPERALGPLTRKRKNS